MNRKSLGTKKIDWRISSRLTEPANKTQDVSVNLNFRQFFFNISEVLFGTTLKRRKIIIYLEFQFNQAM